MKKYYKRIIELLAFSMLLLIMAVGFFCLLGEPNTSTSMMVIILVKVSGFAILYSAFKLLGYLWLDNPEGEFKWISKIKK